MKSLAIISKGKGTCMAIQEQLEALLGNNVSITGYYCNGNIASDIRADLVLVTGRHTFREVQPMINPACPVIIARRSVNYHEVDKLFDLPAHTEVLFVNDILAAAQDTISSLIALGIDHINYHPYAPGLRDYPRLKIAVTPGEAELVPPCAERIIDIKSRIVDITTLMEILQKLAILNNKIDLLSANYLRDIIGLIKESRHNTRVSDKMKSQLQTIINTVHDGIIAVDGENRISVFNPVAESLLGVTAAEVVGGPLDRLLDGGVLGLLNNRGNDKDLFLKVNNHHLIANVAKTRDAGRESGAIYTFKDVSEIQRLEEDLRRELVGRLHVAQYTFGHMQGDSKVARQSVELARKMALSNAPILIQGESGTGKELLAQGIHNASARKNGPFIAVNFAALTESLLESELFGYEEGAFTGARKGGLAGLFEQAHKGTIFLDEVGDAPLPFQVKLLRVLQEKQVRRIGGSRIIPIDVRVIAATNRDLKELIAQGAFRKDLYYRLNVLPLKVPPLKDRKSDILMLAKSFYEGFFSRRKRAIPPEEYFRHIAPQLLAYDWPGNVRELQNVVEYLVNISPDQLPAPHQLPEELRAKRKPLEYPELEALIIAAIAAGNEQGTPVGRRTLAKSLALPESVIRKALACLQQAGFIQIEKGRNGLRIAP